MLYTRINTLWKPHPRFSGKSWSVRGFQKIAAHANRQRGAHFIVIDADIQVHYSFCALHSAGIVFLKHHLVQSLGTQCPESTQSSIRSSDPMDPIALTSCF